MRVPWHVSLRRLGCGLVLLAALSLVFVSPGLTQAVDVPTAVARVEEDWELVIKEPDPDNDAPQIVCVTSPISHVDGVYAALELNHGTQPEYSAGGLQLQVWNGEDWLSVRDHAATTLHHSNETVTWITRMSLDDGKLIFHVLNGHSQSWGEFGGTGTIKLSISTNLTTLAGHSPEVSKSNSGIGFASQRVQSLTLKRVRYYSPNNELLLEDETPRVIHQDL